MPSEIVASIDLFHRGDRNPGRRSPREEPLVIKALGTPLKDEIRDSPLEIHLLKAIPLAPGLEEVPPMPLLC